MRLMRGRRSPERGAVAIVVAVASVLILGAAAFTVDLGMQRVVRSDMQSVADTVALDMARALASGAAPDTPPWTSALSTSLSGDTSTLGHGTAMPAGWTSGTAVCNAKLCAQAMAGYLDANAQFTTTAPAGATTYTAVKVTTTAEVNRGLGNVLGSGDLPATRAAVSTVTVPNTCYKVSSYALGVDTSNSVLGPLLGLANANQAVTVLSSSGVATAEVSLLSLASQLGVGTPSALVTMPSLTMGQFLLASATVLDSQGDTTQAAALRSLQVALGSAAGQPMNLGSLLALGQGDASALDAAVNVGDLIAGSLMVADGVHAINIPGLNVNVPGLGTLTASATVVNPPVIGCNGGVAKAAQVTIELKNTGGALSLPLVASVSNLDLRISLANAWARSDPDAPCSATSMQLDVTHQTLANIRLTAEVKAVLGLIPVASLDTGAPMTVSTSYTLPIPSAYSTPVSAGSGSLGIDLSQASADVLGIIDLGHLVSLLQPVTNAVSSLVTGTLGPLLGLTVAGADLYAIAPTPSCGGPKLVG